MQIAAGLELLGEYDRSGCVQARFLLRRADGRVLEVSSILYYLTDALRDGGTVEDIACVVGARCGRPVSGADVAYLIEGKLRPLGVVDDGACRDGTPTHHPLLGLSIRAGIIPKAVVLAVADVLQPLFRMPVIVTISSGVIAVDAWLGATQRWREGLHQISRQPGLLLAVVGFTLAAGLFHEAGHATATRYGGAEPGPIGAGIYLLWPVFYNDLNDSYRLSRRGRIRADLGGVYFNAVFILAAGAGYALTGFKALLVVIVIQHLAILQQFLPFIRLDGYYLVSDLVGVPDLFGRIRLILESLVPGRTAAAAVMELKSKVRLVVTAWVLLTIPALMAAAALFALNLPRLVNAGWTSLRIQGALLREAAQTGNVLQAMLGVLQLLVIAFPVLGVTALIIGLVRRLRPVTLQAQDVGAHDGGGEQPPVPTGGAADMAMPAGPSDEQARRICAQQNCDNDLPPRGRGRPAVYCSPACWPSRVRPSSRVTATYP